MRFSSSSVSAPDEYNAAAVSNTVRTHTDSTRKALKASLADGSVTYRPNTQAPTVETESLGTTKITTYYYELCVTYKYDDESRSAVTPYMYAEDAKYRMGLNGTSDKAGKHCFDLKATTADAGVGPDARL